MKCPKCQETLIAEIYEDGVEIDRCLTCRGVWLDKDELTDIVEIEEKQFEQKDIIEVMDSVFSGIPKEEIASRTKCVKCSTPMNVVNYTAMSGIIIDRCPENHGIWLDVNELEKIQMYQEESNRRIKPDEQMWMNRNKEIQIKLEEEFKSGGPTSTLGMLVHFFSKYL